MFTFAEPVRAALRVETLRETITSTSIFAILQQLHEWENSNYCKLLEGGVPGLPHGPTSYFILTKNMIYTFNLKHKN